MKGSTKKLEQWHEALLRGRWPFRRPSGDPDQKSLVEGARLVVCELLGHNPNDCRVARGPE